MIDKILLNLIKMLTERGVLLSKNLDKNYKDLLNQKTEERIFKISSDTNNSIYFIMIIYGKISTIKKINGLDAFLLNSKGQNRIFIGDNITQKAFKQFLDFKKTEVFFDYELLMNILEHELQPKFELLSKEERDKKLEEYDVDLKNMSIMFSMDPIARYYSAKPGDIFRILRPSPFAGISFHYRHVIDSSVKLLYDK
ncbi:MAG: hypothetical protein CBC05_03310 [Crocinitomicaceae bacterium TMED45]|nr:MAG: hypothetical protein CBC05_03310 [Crocinitomicaceae bacterium TMED45]|tara:strand:+ start:735 stop:1325 length:591 start_codon:yes stop_codon:yes gene_type:complete